MCTGIYAGRIVGGDWNYRAADRDIAAGVVAGAGEREERAVPEQFAAVGDGVSVLRERLQGSDSDRVCRRISVDRVLHLPEWVALSADGVLVSGKLPDESAGVLLPQPE